MLAQNFKSAVELGISEAQLSSLQKVLVLLETGRLKHRSLEVIYDRAGHGVFSGEFNMGSYGVAHKCGTVACIAGTAEIIAGVKFVGTDRPTALTDLFYGEGISFPLDVVTPAQAATALRSYLTTGSANWEDAVR